MSLKFPNLALTLLVLALTLGGVANAGDDLTPGKQAALLVRVLPYDQNFKGRVEATVTIGVLSREGSASSVTYGLDMTSALRDLATLQPLKGVPIRVLSIAFSDSEDLDAVVSRDKLAAVYVCPGLGDSMEAISAVARRHKILTFSSREAEIRSHLSIGLLRRGTKASLLINVRAASEEGAILDPELLAVAEVLR
jgi:hypothetical protein